MSTVSIVGTGNMGSALAALFERSGATVQTIAHSDFGTATIEGDVVVLAVPYPALAEIAASGRERLAGKTVVDITNPVDFSDFTPVAIDAGNAATELAALLQNSHVLKAFNTNFAATLTAGAVGDAPLTVLVAGDAAEAKQTFVELVSASGAQVLDAGALSRATQLEAVGYLQMGLAIGEQIAWTGGFTAVR